MSQSYISKSLSFVRNFYLFRNIHHIYFLSECLLCLDRGLLPPHFHIVYKPASHIDYHHFSVMEHYILVDIFIQSIMPMQNCLVSFQLFMATAKHMDSGDAFIVVFIRHSYQRRAFCWILFFGNQIYLHNI